MTVIRIIIIDMMGHVCLRSFALLILWTFSRVETCPSGTTLMATINYTAPGSISKKLLQVCEDLTQPNGAIIFEENSIAWLTLRKRVENIVKNKTEDDEYLGWTKAEVMANSTDILGNSLLGIHGHPSRRTEPTLAEVTKAIPPIRSINHCRIWTANRESGRDATYDRTMSNFFAGGNYEYHTDCKL